MNGNNFRAALRASARVALTTTLFSCGGIAQMTTTADVQRPNPEPWVDGSPEGDDASSTAACVAPGTELLPESLDASVSEGTFECCLRALEPALGGDASVAEIDAADVDPAVRSCCEAVVVRLDQDYQTPPTYDPVSPLARDNAILADAGESPVRWKCCALLSFPGGPTCTPWGPPMPPEMPIALQETQPSAEVAS